MRLTESPRVKAELAFKPWDVKRLQEWLWLHGFKLEIDGISGPATKAALEEFRRKNGIASYAPGEVLVSALTAPLRSALESRQGGSDLTTAETVLRFARAHLDAGSREAPGSNRGPWVRLYGEEGQAWCASFVTFVMKQAFELTGLEPPIAASADCDELACQARRTDRLVLGGDASSVSAGDLFVSYRAIAGGHKDYHHTGFIEKVESDHLVTIEGNTNPSGGREGYEVERRFRSFDQKDFIRLS